MVVQGGDTPAFVLLLFWGWGCLGGVFLLDSFITVMVIFTPKMLSTKLKHYGCFFCFFFVFFQGCTKAQGNYWARDRIEVIATSLHHSHRHTRPEPHLQPMLPLVATPDP